MACDWWAPCRVSSRDSGKTAVDAAFGEVMVTCEKIWWLLRQGERWLQPEKRGAGIMVRLGRYRGTPDGCQPHCTGSSWPTCPGCSALCCCAPLGASRCWRP